MRQAGKPIVVPRPAATILVLRDDPLEVLMVRRHSGAVFSSALVFPGGLVDPEDRSDNWLPLIEGADGMDVEERAIRIAALRETFEEASILLARGIDGGYVAPDGDVGGAEFREVVRKSGGKLILDKLQRFGHWITPEVAPKRFDTHFFLCRTSEGQEAICDGGETVALEWVQPADALARFEAGERSILFPTRMNLRRLMESPDSASAIEAARRRPPFTVAPRVQHREDGIAE